MEDKKNGRYGTKMENHIVLVGYDEFTAGILHQIVSAGLKVAVVTNKREQVDAIAEKYDSASVFVLATDFGDYDDLNKANIKKSSKVFINFGNDTETLVYTLDLKNHFSNLEIIVSLENSSLQNTFRSAGVLYAVSRAEIASKLVASYIFEPEVASFTEDLMATEDFDMIELQVTQESPYSGKEYDFAFTDLRKTYSSVLIGIYKDSQLYKNPTEPIDISENDYLIILANGDGASALKNDFGVEEGRFK
jgi:voltage-gated potassium channel